MYDHFACGLAFRHSYYLLCWQSHVRDELFGESCPENNDLGLRARCLRQFRTIPTPCSA
jgi:hypothetical protein